MNKVRRDRDGGRPRTFFSTECAENGGDKDCDNNKKHNSKRNIFELP